MIKKMTGRGARSAYALSEESGVSSSTLCKWKRQACKVLDVSDNDSAAPAKQPSKPARGWTPEDKFRAVMETGAMDKNELGAFLRQHGLFSHQLEQWCEECARGATEALGGAKSTGKRTPEQRRIRQLERELLRKDKALAETTALLVLKKKFQTVFGDEDDGMIGENDKWS